MIQEFQVSNFYSIRDKITLSFVPSADDTMSDYYTSEVKPGVRLLKMGIIYGANASGKTTVLEAISFFRNLMLQRPAEKLKDLGYSPFLLDSHSKNENSYMELTFFIDGEKYTLGCAFNEKVIINEYLLVYASSRPTMLYERSYSKETDHSTVTFGQKIGISKKSQRIIEGNTINNCTVMAAFGQSNVETSRLNAVYEYISNQMLGLLHPRMSVMEYVKDQLYEDKENKIKDFILQILKASDFNITDIVVKEKEQTTSSDKEPTIRLAHRDDDGKSETAVKKGELIFSHSGDGGNFILSERDESAGTKRFLGMGVILYKLIHQNCFLPIDEIETSIHYELLSYFIKLFLANSEGTSQLLMTTHDINLLDEDFIRRDVVWFTTKDANGATAIKRLSNSGLHKSISAYNAYRQGKVVDLPFLGSIFLDHD